MSIYAFWPESQHCPSVKDVRCQTYTQLLANYSSGCLLLSIQSSVTIQTERSDEGGQKQDRKYPILNYHVFLCKNLDNISRPQRTVQNKTQRQFMTKSILTCIFSKSLCCFVLCSSGGQHNWVSRESCGPHDSQLLWAPVCFSYQSSQL